MTSIEWKGHLVSVDFVVKSWMRRARVQSVRSLYIFSSDALLKNKHFHSIYVSPTVKSDEVILGDETFLV